MDEAASKVGRKPLKKRTRLPDDALTHSVNHWIRVEALAIFHEGEFSAGEVAKMIGEDVKVVRGHVQDPTIRVVSSSLATSSWAEP